MDMFSECSGKYNNCDCDSSDGHFQPGFLALGCMLQDLADAKDM